jgi:NADPH-dependent 2,4-dienoyl-CoA reductase/sulfur reductase-like enzyme
MKGLVVIGASYAGVQAAGSAREFGYADDIMIVSDEPELPYLRPPLSKGYLVGETDEAGLIPRGEAYFAARRIELLLGRRAGRIDKVGRNVVLDDGRELACERIVVASGSRARPLPAAAAAGANVVTLRSLADARRLKQRLAACKDLAVIGGGFIGLEVAASARKLGKSVVVIEAADRLIGRALSPTLSTFLLAKHRSNGVDVRLDSRVRAVTARGDKTEIRCVDAAPIVSDLVLVGIGGIANCELARDAGIECDNGIVVDEVGRTSSAMVLAAGDCATFFSPGLGRRVRLESVQHAQDQGRSAGACVAGKYHPYVGEPRFWSDQYDCKIQMVGLWEGHTTHAVRGSLEGEQFSVFLYRNGRLIAVDSVNKPGDQLVARNLIARSVSPSPAQAADLSFDLKSLLSAQSR